MLFKRTCVAIVDIAAALVASLILVVGAPSVALAYVDPSVMTYTIQALAGVAVALSTVFGVAYRRVRKRMVRILGIDENKGKVVDPDVRRIEPEEQSKVKAQAATFWESAPVPGAARKWGFGKRLLRALVIAIFLSGTLFIVAPFELVAANTNDLVFGLKDVWLPMTKVALVAALVLWIVLTLIPGHVGDVLAALACALGVCLWTQAMFLNSGLPSADGALIDWTSYGDKVILSFAVWAVVIIAFVVLTLAWRRHFRPIVVFVALALIVVQGAGVASLFTGDQNGGNKTYGATFQITKQGLYDVSPNSNVIVFVLDMFDTEDLNKLYATNREDLNELTGFTWYTDSVGSLIPTRMAVPFLLSGQYPQDGDTYSTYVENRMHRSTFIEDIAAAGYNIGVYTDTFPYPTTVGDKCDYIMNVGPSSADYSINEEGTVQVLIKTALYRDLPWAFKEHFWYYTDELNQAMATVVDSGAAEEDELYIMDDAGYDDTLNERGLTVKDYGDNGSFRFIHLVGAHYPYTIDENGDNTGKTTTREQQVRGAIKIASDYVRSIKEAGVYDNTTIILTADHGLVEFYEGKSDTCTYASTPIYLIKPAQSTELDAQPLKVISNVSTGHIDYCATVLRAMGADYSKYGPATSDVVPSSPRLRKYYYMPTDINTYEDIELQEYEIDGYGPDFKAWRRTGKTYPNDDKVYHN